MKEKEEGYFEKALREAGQASAEVVEFEPKKSDEEIAKELRERIVGALGLVIDIINMARQRHGMTVSFQIGPPDGFNRQNIVMLEISKKLC